VRWRVLLALVVLAGCHAAAPPVLAHHTPPPAPPAPVPVGEERPQRTVVVDTEIEVLPDVWWDGATAKLTHDAERSLDILADTLVGNPEIRVLEIRAFGGDVSAWALGEERAHVLVEGLVRRHVDPHRLVARGFAVAPAGDGPGPVLTILDRAP